MLIPSVPAFEESHPFMVQQGDYVIVRDDDPFGTKAPYWRRHFGIGRPWTPSPRGRKGCLFMLYACIAVIVGVFLVAGIAALIR